MYVDIEHKDENTVVLKSADGHRLEMNIVDFSFWIAPTGERLLTPDEIHSFGVDGTRFHVIYRRDTVCIRKKRSSVTIPPSSVISITQQK